MNTDSATENTQLPEESSPLSDNSTIAAEFKLNAETRGPHRGKAATETAEYTEYAEGETKAVLSSAYSVYSAVLILGAIARRQRTI